MAGLLQPILHFFIFYLFFYTCDFRLHIELFSDCAFFLILYNIIYVYIPANRLPYILISWKKGTDPITALHIQLTSVIL
jgi:hypothetical protein